MNYNDDETLNNLRSYPKSEQEEVKAVIERARARQRLNFLDIPMTEEVKL
jgi:hypothetical protein|tara:strand:- start:5298 stop:5447 length:150 start_codon:yes stop_codon:yes gene_type:complete